ncbi:hypothetical protein J1N35_041715 [Gossypium stocksii]|uniref:Xylose isomerase n=1 Tax=Gossypium stocksii TaxID=47602 RepID=A0A9D3ZJJ2_9ROSI|nr:hypothetical protein J1N35_041715 [Gossypium stocksii]
MNVIIVNTSLQDVRANFEFLNKLGVDRWCFHDRDIAPDGKPLKETNSNLDEVVALAKELQGDMIRPLWGTAQLFMHPRYMHGTTTSSELGVYAYAAAQVKKAMEVTHYLGGENYVFWGGREGYQTLLNTDMERELDHMNTKILTRHIYENTIDLENAHGRESDDDDGDDDDGDDDGESSNSSGFEMKLTRDAIASSLMNSL